MKLVIDREYWQRGIAIAHLLSPNGKMCCLGFLGKACGAEDKDILLLGSPSSARSVNWPKTILNEENFGLNTELCYELMSLNDKTRFDEKERETLLTEKFHSVGIEVEFIN